MEDIKGIEVIVESLNAGERYIKAHGGTARMGRCWAKGATSGGHFVVWPNTAGVSLRNMVCPEHGADRHEVRQTVGGQVGRTIVATKAFVVAIGKAATTAKAARAAELRDAGTTKLVRDLVAGDVFAYCPKSSSRTELPTFSALRVVEAEKLTAGKVRLVVVGSADSWARRSGAYARYGLNGVEADLTMVEVKVEATVSGTATVVTSADGVRRGYRAGEELAAAVAGELTWADQADLNVAELDRLSGIAIRRAAAIADSEEELAKVEAKLANPTAHAHVTQDVARFVELTTQERDRRAAALDRFRSDLAAVEARLDELTALISSPAIAEEPEKCDHVGTDRVERVAHGHLNDAPAGTVQILCAACGAELDEPADYTEADLRLAGGNKATARAIAAERAAALDADGELGKVGIGEEDMLPAEVCGNCLAFAGEPTAMSPGGVYVITFDEASGRRLCQECEPAPMVDGIYAGQAVRIGPRAGANAGREAIVVRHEGAGTVVQVLGQGVERTYHRSELTPAAVR